jgi:hypothetical protein
MTTQIPHLPAFPGEPFYQFRFILKPGMVATDSYWLRFVKSG